VSAVFTALVTPSAKGEVINEGSGQAISVRAVIETGRSIIGRGTPQYGAIGYRPGENMTLFADIT